MINASERDSVRWVAGRVQHLNSLQQLGALSGTFGVAVLYADP